MIDFNTFRERKTTHLFKKCHFLKKSAVAAALQLDRMEKLKQKGLSQKLSKRLRKASPIVAERLEAYVPRAVLASLKGRSGGRDAERWAGETVSCCCVFMDLGLDSDTLERALHDDGALRSVHAAFAAAAQRVGAEAGAAGTSFSGPQPLRPGSAFCLSRRGS